MTNGLLLLDEFGLPQPLAGVDACQLFELRLVAETASIAALYARLIFRPARSETHGATVLLVFRCHLLSQRNIVVRTAYSVVESARNRLLVLYNVRPRLGVARFSAACARH